MKKLVLLVVLALTTLIALPAVALADSYQYVTAWGSQGSGNGQFDDIRAIAMDGSGNLYVADYGNARIEKLSSSGAYSCKCKPRKKGAYRVHAAIARSATHGAVTTKWLAFKVK